MVDAGPDGTVLIVAGLAVHCHFTLRTFVLYSRHVEAHESLFDAVCPARAAACGGWHQGFVRGRQRN